MTAKMTDDELRLDGFLRAKAIYLPQVQQLQVEIERLTIRCKELNNLSDAIRDGEKFQQLTAKHERLVKGMKEITTWMYDMQNNDGKYIYDHHGTVVFKSDIQKLITESEDKTGPSIQPQSLANRWG